MNTDSIIAARETYRAATVKFVDDNFHLFKLNDKRPSFEEMCVYIESTRDRRVNVNKSERKWFIERVQTILRHEYSNYDELVRQMRTKECGDRFAYLIKQKVKELTYKNYDWEGEPRRVRIS